MDKLELQSVTICYNSDMNLYLKKKRLIKTYIIEWRFKNRYVENKLRNKLTINFVSR